MRAPARWPLVAILCLAGGVAPARGAGGSVDGLADDVAARLLPSLTDAAADVAVTARLRDGSGRLAGTLEGLVVARLSRSARARSIDVLAGGDAARARAAGYERWIDLEIAIDGGEVVVLGRVLETDWNLWREISSRVPRGAVQHATVAKARLDAELRALLAAPPEPTVVVTPDRPPPKKRRLVFRQQEDPLDVGAPLLALAAGDLDGDGAAELVALTTREVIVLDVGAEDTRVVKSFTLGGDPAAARPRDPVGSLLVADVDGDGVVEVLARSSERASGAILVWKDGVLARKGELANHPLCALPDETGAIHVLAAILGDGVNWFPREGLFLAPEWKGFAPPALPERFLAMRCAAGAAAAVDDAGKLRLYAVGAAPSAGAGRDATATLSDVGAAFELADLDGDGAAEVVTSAWRAPGDGDVLAIVNAAGKTVHKGSALRGGVAAIAAGDFNGDGAVDVAAFVRLVDATRGDVWVLQ